MRLQFFAHSVNEVGTAERVSEHLTGVARRAAEYADSWDGRDEAFVAGLLHDMGKYGELFQRRLEGRERGIDHWSLGAWIALNLFKNEGIASALAIQGHHIGLQQASGDALRELNPAKLQQQHPAGLRLSEESVEVVRKRFENDGLAMPGPDELPETGVNHLSAPAVASMLDVRMLFSCVVDADFIETEAHFEACEDGTKFYRPCGPELKPETAVTALSAYLAQLSAQSTSSPEIRRLRADLLEACNNAAGQDRGLFTLTAPTGAGKTLSLLSFALRHAAAHGLRRIVVVNPYLNIIEQTVDVYRKALETWVGDRDVSHCILEHHSLAATKDEEKHLSRRDRDHQTGPARIRRLLTQNWDAPIVITTTVQFFESLFADRPGPCRKLHRLANSVIIFDEAQTLPVSLAVPTLAALSRLAQRYGSSVVFSTATQPAFAHLDEHVKQFCSGGWAPREVVPTGLDLFDRAKRTSVRWPRGFSDRVSWERLRHEIADEPQILCIVNLKRHALQLFHELKGSGAEGLFHLSTNMCPLHRRAVLDSIKRRLLAGSPCRLIATQCVEAGVDLDFPTVFRSWAPLDAITQAAGRCNRNDKAAMGTVRVFIPEDEAYPDGAYSQAAAITRLLAQQTGEKGPDIHSPQTFATYYPMLYTVSRPESQNPELTAGVKLRDFGVVSKAYRLIDRNAINVLVPYDTSSFEELQAEASSTGLTRTWITRARPHCISLFTPKPNDAVLSYLDPVQVGAHGKSEEWFVYLDPGHYDLETGLVPPDTTDCLIA